MLLETKHHGIYLQSQHLEGWGVDQEFEVNIGYMMNFCLKKV